MSLSTRERSQLPDVTAPDGSEVRILASTSRGSMAQFTLPPAPGAAAAGATPALRVVTRTPLVVTGVHFRAAERVTVAAAGVTRVVRASRQHHRRVAGKAARVLLWLLDQDRAIRLIGVG